MSTEETIVPVIKAPVLKSLYFKQDEILEAIKILYCPEGFDCDVTYGNGVFYKNFPKPRFCFDLSPQVEGVVQSDSRALPLEATSINSLMFDPPFLTYIKGGREHSSGGSIMASRFSGYWSYSELEEHYYNTIKEASRVLKSEGKLIVKCQDIIHNHQMKCTHAMVIQMALEFGMVLKDMFILGAKHRIPVASVRKQQHARIYHSYFLVFEKVKVKKQAKV